MFRAFIVVLLVLGNFPVAADDAPTEPMLRISTEMHTAQISGIGVDRDERYAVTSSPDKTVKLWDLSDGTLLNTFRVPISASNDGKLYAVALSPDGETIATAGWTGFDWDSGHSIYTINRLSGRLARPITGLPEIIFHLCYSQDGRYLAATLARGHGLRVYDTHNDYTQVIADSDYGGGQSFSCHFDSKGRLVTTSFDGFLRLYNARFKRIAKRRIRGGKRPFAARFSPDDATVAVGFYDTSAVNVLSGRNLRFKYAANTKQIENITLFTVTWSHDGQFLYGAGGTRGTDDKWFIRRWSRSGRGEGINWPVADNTIVDLWPLANGGVLVGSSEPALVKINSQGEPLWRQQNELADMHLKFGDNFQLSRDASQVIFGLGVGSINPVTFDVVNRALSAGKAENLLSPRTTAAGLVIDNWENNYSKGGNCHCKSRGDRGLGPGS